MRIYIVKRILSMIPALLFIVLLSFLLLHFSPGDPVERILSNQGSYDANTPTTTTENLRNELTHKLGLDLPVFYFSISDLSHGKNNSPEWQKYFPSISFNSNNQFHNWLFGNGNYTNGILRGDFGYSWISGQKVS